MTINKSIVSVFPKHILCLDNICLDYLDVYSLCAHKLIEQNGYYTNELLNVKSTHRTVTNLHEYEDFQHLVSVIERYVVEFGNFLGYDIETCFRMRILNMWVNINKQGGYNFPHIHSGSILSGVFYVKSPSKNKIIFFDNYSNTEIGINSHGEGYDTKSFDCIPGRLLMFKSDLIHGNTPQIDTEEKIAISFNIVRA